MIKILAMDVDGTLTDGKIYMGSNGELMKAFNIKDGCGIAAILIPAGIVPVIITARKSKILENRCRELGITELHQGVSDKLGKLRTVVESFGVKLSNVAYIGDDINDLACMRAVLEAGGCVGCPADAVIQVRALVNYIAGHNGGDGAVRDFIEWICNHTERLQ